jgi:phosphate uptake regulator
MLERLFGSKRSALIETAFEEVSEMLRQSLRMMDLATAALLDNQALDVDMDSLDDTVDRGEQMVRRSVLEHLSFNPKQDLVASLVLLSIVHDAERVGDFARGLTTLLPLARSRREGPFAERSKVFADRVRSLFALSEEGFRRDDRGKAQEVVDRVEELKVDLHELAVDLAASDLTADMAVVYFGANQMLRRMASHLGNIASTVVQPFDRIQHTDG